MKSCLVQFLFIGVLLWTWLFLGSGWCMFFKTICKKFFALFSLCFQIGNWSRWLTDLFGIDDSDPYEDGIETDDKKLKCEKSFKAFHLLNALSDLMMLPFEMIADRSIRKEVKSCNFNAFRLFMFFSLASLFKFLYL